MSHLMDQCYDLPRINASYIVKWKIYAFLFKSLRPSEPTSEMDLGLQWLDEVIHALWIIASTGVFSVAYLRRAFQNVFQVGPLRW